MKSLQLESMLLVSHREKKARKIDFDPEVTVIKGENDTGKSSVIKSIQSAFGASPHNVHKNWINADVHILIKFNLDGVSYYIYRHRGSFSLFDASKNIIGTYSSVTNELAPKLAQIFDFRLKLTDRDGKSITPPPAYLMLPFYLDQDKGWVGTWCSFKNLGQFSHWKPRVAGYHFGIKPDKWYQLDSDRKNLEAEKDEPERQIRAIQSVRDKTLSDFSGVDFDIDIDSFRDEINGLINRCNDLKRKEGVYKNQILEAKTEKIRIEAQIEIVARTHDELSDDYKYSSKIGDVVDCPTCGAHYDNSFSERFNIAQDTETCVDLLSSLRDDLSKIATAISKSEIMLGEARETRAQINQLLTKKQGDIKLKDLIDLESKKSLLAHLDKESAVYSKKIEEINGKIGKAKDEMKKYDDPERRKHIVEKYGESLRKNTIKLNVHSLDDSIYKNITPAIEESGSDLPRAILAYFFTSIEIIKKNGNATFFPIVIDAPNQQEQDKDNLNKILKFIKDRRPEGKQLVLGLVDSGDMDLDGKVLEFDKKYSVLSEDLYQSGAEEINHFESHNLAIEE
jgi:DNA repair exonuclease SbcCD ATPase subunit